MLRLLLGKELRALLREPLVVMTILMPLVVYSSMAPFYGEVGRQAREAARLEGVKMALAACRVDPATMGFLELLVGRVSAGANTSIDLVRGCDALALLGKSYDVVVVFNGSLSSPRLAVYVKGSLEKLARTLSLPGAVASRLGEAFTGGVNITASTYVYLQGRLYSFQDLNALFSSMVTLAYAALFVLFPAAATAASLVGAEREERTLEVLLSLPVRRRDVALSKAAAAIVIAGLTAASALAGLLMAFQGAGVRVEITRFYGVAELGVYAAALMAEALFVSAAAMTIALFASTMRGAQGAATIVVVPAIIPPMLLLTGVSPGGAAAAVPYMAALLAALSPLAGLGPAARAAVVQLLEAAALMAVFVRLLEGETAVSGPETLKRLLARLRSRRGPGGA